MKFIFPILVFLISYAHSLSAPLRNSPVSTGPDSLRQSLRA
jgi:hypothetical protein